MSASFDDIVIPQEAAKFEPYAGGGSAILSRRGTSKWGVTFSAGPAPKEVNGKKGNRQYIIHYKHLEEIDFGAVVNKYQPIEGLRTDGIPNVQGLFEVLYSHFSGMINQQTGQPYGGEAAKLLVRQYAGQKLPALADLNRMGVVCYGTHEVVMSEARGDKDAFVSTEVKKHLALEEYNAIPEGSRLTEHDAGTLDMIARFKKGEYKRQKGQMGGGAVPNLLGGLTVPGGQPGAGGIPQNMGQFTPPVPGLGQPPFTASQFMGAAVQPQQQYAQQMPQQPQFAPQQQPFQPPVPQQMPPQQAAPSNGLPPGVSFPPGFRPGAAT